MRSVLSGDGRWDVVVGGLIGRQALKPHVSRWPWSIFI